MHAGWLWIVALGLIAIGLIGTVLPALPGAAAVFGGMLLGAWLDDFQRISWVTVVVLGVLTALTFAADILGSVFGARRVGASRLALLGAAIGALIGMFFGFVGMIFSPFLGAVAGELISRGRVGQAARIGIGTWLGLLLGTLAKVALVASMLVIFVSAYFIP
ncbi:MAG: DUF456 family protein [Steroidobacteraceae bacterium]